MFIGLAYLLQKFLVLPIGTDGSRVARYRPFSYEAVTSRKKQYVELN